MKILIIHPELEFRDFMQRYLRISGFEVKTAADCIEGFTIAIHMKPQLIIINKDFKGFDARGFLGKKSVNQATINIPVFVIGEFHQDEIVDFKKMHVMAFISNPVNPVILQERICQLFRLPLPAVKKTTPMLVDINARGNIIIIQIEGNLEAEKLEVMNYTLRLFCRQKALTKPRFFFIIPSLYPEQITGENVSVMFGFINFSELAVEPGHVRILTNLKELVNVIRENSAFKDFGIVDNFFDGFRDLQLDFDKRKTIPVEFLKKGSLYIFDLFDNSGKRIISALSPVTSEIKEYIRQNGISFLTYYSDLDAEHIEHAVAEEDMSVWKNGIMDTILGAYEPVVLAHSSVSVWDEKMTLFFRSQRGQKVMLFSHDPEIMHNLSRSLDTYFSVESGDDGANITEIYGESCVSLVFLDSTIGEERILEILHDIRTTCSRRKTSIIILADRLQKTSVLRFRDAGTDNIIAKPFTQNRLLSRIFESVTADRRT